MVIFADVFGSADEILDQKEKSVKFLGKVQYYDKKYENTASPLEEAERI